MGISTGIDKMNKHLAKYQPRANLLACSKVHQAAGEVGPTTERFGLDLTSGIPWSTDPFASSPSDSADPTNEVMSTKYRQ